MVLSAPLLLLIFSCPADKSRSVVSLEAGDILGGLLSASSSSSLSIIDSSLAAPVEPVYGLLRRFELEREPEKSNDWLEVAIEIDEEEVDLIYPSLSSSSSSSSSGINSGVVALLEPPDEAA